MKKQINWLLILVILLIGITPIQALASANPPQVACDSAIVMDAATGQVLYQKNADKKEYPASTTKILTTALVLEKGLIQKATTVSANAVKSIGKDGTDIRGIHLATDPSIWARPYLEKAIEEGLVDKSWFEGRAKPVTRGEVIGALAKLVNVTLINEDMQDFKSKIKGLDNLEPRARESVLKIYALGLLSCVKDGTMGLSQPISREELMMVLHHFGELKNIQ